ncbi:hypothetical protein INR49_006648 [Caranx melampygus]|nr:hypothetical protein INR49_006648 [Caranx melampygus]
MDRNTGVLTGCCRFLLLCLWAVLRAEQPADDGGGGWSLPSDFRLEDEGPCNIDVFDSSSLSYQQFIESGRPFPRIHTLYFFGDNNFTEWQRLFDHYQPPPYGLPHSRGAFSFGIAGPGTGVPFHWHGPGYSEVVYGRKRWFLYPPDKEPHFHPNRTTLSWVTETYPHLPEDEAPLECTIRPGEVLYFPDHWWHATLNLDTSVFISTFLG